MKTARIHLAVAGISMALLLCCARPGCAQLFTIDQSATPPSVGEGSFGRLFSGTTVGQEFRPTLPALDFIDVGLISMDPNDTGTFQVHLRHQGAGQLLATSEPVSVSNGQPGLVHFSFANSVPLTPGETYFFHIPHDGPYWGAIIGPTTYDRGSASVVEASGWPADYDLWFREGIVVPEPATWQLAAAASTLLLLTSRLKARR
jgi:hypothetical protein